MAYHVPELQLCTYRSAPRLCHAAPSACMSLKLRHERTSCPLSSPFVKVASAPRFITFRHKQWTCNQREMQAAEQCYCLAHLAVFLCKSAAGHRCCSFQGSSKDADAAACDRDLSHPKQDRKFLSIGQYYPNCHTRRTRPACTQWADKHMHSCMLLVWYLL